MNNNTEPKKRHGFTLVELLCCIGIAGLVVGAIAGAVAHGSEE